MVRSLSKPRRHICDIRNIAHKRADDAILPKYGVLLRVAIHTFSLSLPLVISSERNLHDYLPTSVSRDVGASIFEV